MESHSSNDFKSASNEKFSTKERDILEKNRNFFSTDYKYLSEMLEIINGCSNISIRVLDWFVANYSKKKNTFYKIKINGREHYFYVHIEYKNQLNGYTKQYFDPFCRKKKIVYSYKNEDKKKNTIFLSSIGQLNFFQWAIKNKVIRYVQYHLEEIENDMKQTSKKNKERKNQEIDNTKNNKQKIHQSSITNYDPLICCSNDINSLTILNPSPSIKPVCKKRRQQLSKSVYEIGIKQSNVPIKLFFDN